MSEITKIKHCHLELFSSLTMDNKKQSWQPCNRGLLQSNSDSTYNVPVSQNLPGKIPSKAERTIETKIHFLLFEQECDYSVTIISGSELLVSHVF